MKHLKRPTKYIPPIRRNNRTWAKSNAEKADVFAEHLQNILQSKVNHEETWQEVNEDNVTIPFVTLNELKKEI